MSVIGFLALIEAIFMPISMISAITCKRSKSKRERILGLNVPIKMWPGFDKVLDKKIGHQTKLQSISSKLIAKYLKKFTDTTSFEKSVALTINQNWPAWFRKIGV